ncbi:MAG: MerR family transcriptional regulator [Candidatus Komeilibacteria bacterium]|nr:MerR family transcriptional regulator [Candidatus Komeilibacteria bacterium]
MNHLKIGQLAQAAGCLPSTIHFYTQAGLIRPSEHTRGGYRLYDPAVLKTIRRIHDLQEKKRLTIAEIKQKITNH